MAERRARTDRLHRLDRRPQGLCLCRALCRGQARRRRADARAGRRDREDRRHRQCGLPGLRRDRHAGRARRPRSSSKTGRTPEEARAALRRTNPQGRFIQPEEVAATVLWLCSDGGADRSPARRSRFREARHGEPPLASPGIRTTARRGCGCGSGCCARRARSRRELRERLRQRVRHDAAALRRDGRALPRAAKA